MPWRITVMKEKSLCIALFLILAFTGSSPATAADPVSIKQSDKCPVCGMFVAKYTHWIAQVVFRDGSYAAFDGPKDMFKYYLNMSKYAPSRKSADITGIFVTEYYSTKLLDARKLFFVAGSDVYGPMGDELIPLATRAGAEEFMKDHKGTRILKFEDVTNELMR